MDEEDFIKKIADRFAGKSPGEISAIANEMSPEEIEELVGDTPLEYRMKVAAQVCLPQLIKAIAEIEAVLPVYVFIALQEMARNRFASARLWQIIGTIGQVAMNIEQAVALLNNANTFREKKETDEQITSLDDLFNAVTAALESDDGD